MVDVIVVEVIAVVKLDVKRLKSKKKGSRSVLMVEVEELVLMVALVKLEVKRLKTKKSK